MSSTENVELSTCNGFCILHWPFRREIINTNERTSLSKDLFKTRLPPSQFLKAYSTSSRNGILLGGSQGDQGQ